MSTGGDFWGARVVEVKATDARTLSARVHGVAGSIVVIATRPANQRFFAFQVLAGDFRIKPGYHVANFFLDGAVNVADDEVTLFGGHGYTTGVGPYQLTSSGTLPAGLSLLTDYFLGLISTDVIAFYLTHNDAVKDTNRVDITAAVGGGGHTFNTVPNVNPVATNEDGQESLFVSSSTNGEVFVVAAPDRVSIRGTAGPARMVYWFLP
ncbi:hypothetical protein LCGC14_1465000 [marine sediment metagenome]|uniref:Uncharacterized protein n=1 Tax=marine sediment metagenome TaxID=412755 RepID=A0A0F9JZY8_9ZZZZ